METDFEQYVAARAGSLLRLAYVLTRDAHHAEDLVQEVLTRAHSRWSRIERADNVHAYVRRMVVNESVTGFRRRRVRELFRPPEHMPDQAVDDSEKQATDRDAVWQMLARLPVRQHAVLVLRYYEDLSDTQIAETLLMSSGTVRSLASRGLATLRSQPTLSAYLGDEPTSPETTSSTKGQQ